MARESGIRVDLKFKESAVDDVRNGIQEAFFDPGNGIADTLLNYAKRLAPVDTGTFMRSLDWVRVGDLKFVLGSSDVPGKVAALEDGHSDQAPTGVFGPTLNRNKRRIKRIIRKKLSGLDVIAGI